MWEDSILPGAVLGADWLLADDSSTVWARHSVRIVAVVCQAASKAGEGKTVWTGLDDWLIGGLITLIVIITILLVGEHGASLALVGATEVLRRLRWWPVLCMDCGCDRLAIKSLAQVGWSGNKRFSLWKSSTSRRLDPSSTLALSESPVEECLHGTYLSRCR